MPSKRMKTKVHSRALAAILKGKGTVADLDARTRRIAAAGGSGMVAQVEVGPTRARGSVITATNAARRREAKNRALTRALDAGR